METYRDFHDDFYSPRLLFKIAYQVGKEVAHGIPVPDQLGWLVSFPLVTLPLLVVAVAYANGYLVSLGTLYLMEQTIILSEKVWDEHLVEYWEAYVPEAYREPVEEVMTDVRMSEKARRAEAERKRKKKQEEMEKRGQGQKNVTEDSKGGISFKRRR